MVKLGVYKFYVNRPFGEKYDDIKKLLKTKIGRKKIFFSTTWEGSPLFNRGGLVKLKRSVGFKKCLRPSRDLIIDYQGNVILCCNDYFSKYQFGNLKKEKIIDVWNKKNFRKIRNQCKRGIYLLDICRKCREMHSSKAKREPINYSLFSFWLNRLFIRYHQLRNMLHSKDL